MKHRLEESEKIAAFYSNTEQYFDRTLDELDEDERCFLRSDAAELILALEELTDQIDVRE